MIEISRKLHQTTKCGWNNPILTHVWAKKSTDTFYDLSAISMNSLCTQTFKYMSRAQYLPQNIFSNSPNNVLDKTIANSNCQGIKNLERPPSCTNTLSK